MARASHVAVVRDRYRSSSSGSNGPPAPRSKELSRSVHTRWLRYKWSCDYIERSDIPPFVYFASRHRTSSHYIIPDWVCSFSYEFWAKHRSLASFAYFLLVDLKIEKYTPIKKNCYTWFYLSIDVWKFVLRSSKAFYDILLNAYLNQVNRLDNVYLSYN